MAAGIAGPVKAKLTRELKKRMQEHRGHVSSPAPPIVAVRGKAKSVPAAFKAKAGARKGGRGSSTAWLDTSALQADPDMPVAREVSYGSVSKSPITCTMFAAMEERYGKSNRGGLRLLQPKRKEGGTC